MTGVSRDFNVEATTLWQRLTTGAWVAVVI